MKPSTSQGALAAPPPRIQAFAFSTKLRAWATSCTRPMDFAAAGRICSPLSSICSASPVCIRRATRVGAASAGKQPDLDFRQADPSLVAVGEHAVMARQRQLERAAKAGAMHRCDEGFAAGFKLPVKQGEPAAFLEENLHRLLLTLDPLDTLELDTKPLQHGEISAAGEGFLAGDDDTALDGRIGHDCINHLIESAITSVVMTFMERPGCPRSVARRRRHRSKAKMAEGQNELPSFRVKACAVPVRVARRSISG